MADYQINEHLGAIASGEECPKCGFPIYDPPGCQCEDEDDDFDEDDELEYMLGGYPGRC